jgi:predicted nucleotidyltransferase
MLDELLGSKTRAKMIAALLVAPEGHLHLRALVRAAGGSVAGVQREVARLETMGLVTSERDERGRRQIQLVADHAFTGPLGELLAADPRAQYEARIAAIEHLDPRVAEALSGYVDAIVTGFDPIRIVLFGSQVRGTADQDSDIDLLVVLPKVENDQRAMQALRTALPRTGVPVDVIPTDPRRVEKAKTMMASVVRDAIEEGEVVYERPA